MVVAGRGALHRRGPEDRRREVRQEGAACKRGTDERRNPAGGEALMARATAREHTIGRDTYHFKWDNSNPPAVEIEPGDVVHFDTEEVTAGQLKKGDPASKLGALDFDRLYPLGRPVYVKGAHPGDTLEVEILQLKHRSWGWSALLPGLGLLAS